jgi:hypothetical protein
VLAELTDPDDCVDVGAARARAEDPAGSTSKTKRGAKKPRVGHGRNGARDYEGAAVVELNELGVKAGDLCPSCQTGRVYPFAPRVLVKITGQPPLAATVYKVARLRCRLCDAVITAAMPPGLEQQPKYDAACASMLAVLRYGYGMPFFRLEALQRSLGVPLSDATQWDIVSNAVAAPKAVFTELIRQAAQAPLLHSDDTRMKVLQLMAERARAEREGRKPEAKAINTSAIVAVLEQQRQVVLYFTGHAHAGDNMQRVLEQRAQTLSPPLHMCDALAANVAGGFDTQGCNCLTHGRRQVVEIAPHFPAAARRVIDDLASVYEHDARCREQALTPQQRLAFHQEHSQPILQALHGWINEQFEQRLVEPNSGLGKALKYLLRHWKKLTLFLRVAGAPLGRVEMWRGDGRSRHRCFRPFRSAVPYEPDHGFVSTSPSSNRTCATNASNVVDHI